MTEGAGGDESLVYDREGLKLHLGDCMAVLATMPANSVDAVVTDPPYGLEFMGREFDSLVPKWAVVESLPPEWITEYQAEAT